MIRRSTLILCCSLLAFPALSQAQDFTGDGDGTTWNDPDNWEGSVIPTGGTNADIGDGFDVTLATDQSQNEVDVVGDQSVGTATLTQTAGNMAGGGWFKVGVDAGNNGTFTQTGGTQSGYTVVRIGDNGVGTFNLSGTASFEHSNDLFLAINGGPDDAVGGGIAELNLSGDAVLNTVDQVSVANGGTATVNISENAVWNFENLNSSNGGGIATINQTGGTLNANAWFALSQDNTGDDVTPPVGLATFNQSGGTLNVGLVNDAEFMTVGENGFAVYNASGSATVNTPGILVGRNTGGSGQVEITGSDVTINTGSLAFGLQSNLNDAGAEGGISFIADAGGVSTIVATGTTQFGAIGTQSLSVDLTADMGFSTFSSTGVGEMSDIAVLIENVDPVVGTFTGLAEGASVSIGGGQTGFISYVGGSGNDIVIQAFAPEGDAIKGDVDMNGAPEFFDIAPFIEVLAGQGFQAEADCNCDGVVTFFDIQPFIDILAGP